MPGLVAFGRRWSVGSDDLFLPSFLLCIFHTIWFFIILVTLIVDSGEMGPENKNSCSSYLRELLLTSIGIHISAIVFEVLLTFISLRGSIFNDAPRTSAQYLLYARLIVLLTELTWTGFGVMWIRNHYWDCVLHASKRVILGLVICTWFIFTSLLITVWCVYDVAGRSWIKMKRYQANLKEMEMKRPAYRRSGSRHRNWRKRKVIRAYQNSWNHRCRLLFCCLRTTQQHRDSFTDLAKLLSEFFQDLDVVPSDVVVGLLLLRRLQRLEQCSIVKQKRNNTYEYLSGIPITPRTKFVAMNDADDLEVFRNVVHYMHYAVAAYGWPWYLIPNGVQGVCKLCSNLQCCCHASCFCRRSQDDLSDVVVEDNCCYCNYSVIPTMFPSGSTDVIFATYHVAVGETAFFVVVDYDKGAVVVSIRGTLSLTDVITDLNMEGEPLPLQPQREDWLGHKGMVQAAVYMKTKLLGEGILHKAFHRNSERGTERYKLVLVGHSLGAGTAAILAVLLRKEYPTLSCFAYSPPGGLLSMPVVDYTKEFVTSVILGKDVVPRIGLSQMEALRADLINAIKKSQKPKWQTILSGVACCNCVQQEFAKPQRVSSAPSLQNEEFLRSRRSLKDLREVTINPNESAISLTVHQPLFPPGRIMHIVRHHPKKDERLFKKGEPVFQALWTENTDYGHILISPGMIQDHMPDQVLHALQRVVNNHGPAKPQRRMASSSSPLFASKDSLLEPLKDNEIKNESSVCRETSFVSNPSPNVNDCKTAAATPRSGPLMNPSPFIIDADADIEDGADMTFDYVLASFNLSWDYVTNIRDQYVKKGQINGHERKGSFGNYSSSGCSDTGSTFKEMFGPVRYEEVMAPLASPETLSEISSLSSRASFLIPRDQSPLFKVKISRNGANSASLHRCYRNGRGGGNSNGSHYRSLSCSYPETVCEGDVATISSHLPGPKVASPKLLPMMLNGAGHRVVFDEKQSSTNNFSNHEDYPCPELPMYIGAECEHMSSYANKDFEDGEATPVVEEEPICTIATIEEAIRKNGESKRVSFNLKKKYASKDSGCSVEDTTYIANTERYEPIYPVFSHQHEYGVPHLNSPHYNYCGQSPVDSPEAIMRLSNPNVEVFQFPENPPTDQ